MAFSLGGLASGLVSGYDLSQKWKQNSLEQARLKTQDDATAAWGKTLASLGVDVPSVPGAADGGAPSINPYSYAAAGPATGGVQMPPAMAMAQAAQPAQPRPPLNSAERTLMNSPPPNASGPRQLTGYYPPRAGEAGSVMAYNLPREATNGYTPSPALPPAPPPSTLPGNYSFGGGIAAPAQMPAWNQPAPQPPQGGAPQGGAPQGGAPMGGQGAASNIMAQGPFSMQQVAAAIKRANPDASPQVIAEAMKNALPYMKQEDQMYYKQLTANMQQERANTSRDQGWARIQQTADRVKQTAQAHQENLALNMARLEEAKRKGDISLQRLLEDQINRDRRAKTDAVNSLSNLLRSATPQQLSEPAYKADVEMLQQQIEGLKSDPAPSSAPSDAKGAPVKKEGGNNEDAAPAKSSAPIAAPKVGERYKGYTYLGGDPSDPLSWASHGVPVLQSKE